MTPNADAAAVDWIAEFFEGYNSLPADNNPCSVATIEAHFNGVEAFRNEREVPLYLGEFAVVDWAPADSRRRWLSAVVRAAERRKIPWAYWDDGGHNQGMDVGRGAWVEEVGKGLGLTLDSGHNGSGQGG